MIKLNIDVTKIPKDRIKSDPKWKGKYLSCILLERPNDKGDDGFISIDITKEERDEGERGPIIGNWKHLGAKPQTGAAAKRTAPAGRPAPARDPDLDGTAPDDSQIPF